jgi:hypothetical protein
VKCFVVGLGVHGGGGGSRERGGMSRDKEVGGGVRETKVGR